jgi:3-hydroxyisobutyrate dehydrogenase-like beta-hydroxyacid dehydrogenase
MGTALATVLAHRGHPTTVWNRTATRAEPLAAAGAAVARSAADAIAASPLTIFSLLDYDAVHEVLATVPTHTVMAGRTLINLTSGGPAEAEHLAELVASRGADYLDGNVGCYPDAIGTAESHVVYTGPKHVFERARPCLTTLGEDLRYLGDNHGAGNALFLAAAAAHTSELLAAFFAAAYGRRHGLAFGVVTSEIARHSQTTHSYLRQIEGQLEAGDYTATAASVRVYVDALEALAEDMAGEGFQNPVFDSLMQVLHNAAAAGHGDAEFAVLYKLFSDQAL